MNHMAQWCSIFSGKRLQMADSTDMQHLAERLTAFMAAWHASAHPLRESTKAGATVMATGENLVDKVA